MCNLRVFIMDDSKYYAVGNLLWEANRKWTYLKDYIRKHANNPADDRRLVYQRVLDRMNKLDSIFCNNTLGVGE